jgi:hypothetical protein
VNETHALAARRQLLVACATLQRVRLAHEWQGVRAAAQPGRWAATAIGGAGLALVLSMLVHRAHAAAPSRTSVWVARGFALWRLVRALRRVMAAG